MDFHYESEEKKKAHSEEDSSPPHKRKHGPDIRVFMFADVAPLDVKGEDRKADEF